MLRDAKAEKAKMSQLLAVVTIAQPYSPRLLSNGDQWSNSQRGLAVTVQFSVYPR